jgi:hypothetical protein
MTPIPRNAEPGPFIGRPIEWGGHPSIEGGAPHLYTQVDCPGPRYPIRITCNGQMVFAQADPEAARDLADDLYAAANWCEGRDSPRRR